MKRPMIARRERLDDSTSASDPPRGAVCAGTSVPLGARSAGRSSPALLAGAKWVACAAAVFALLSLCYATIPALRWAVATKLALWTAVAVEACCAALGEPIQRGGTFLALSVSPFYVARECTGVDAFAVEASIVLAAPVCRRARIAGLGLAVLLVFSVNLVRLVSLAIAGQHSLAVSRFLDFRLWPVLYAVAMLLATWRWFLWARRMSAAASPAGPGPGR
jgi:exosortase/archaeosortase family protein